MARPDDPACRQGRFKDGNTDPNGEYVIGKCRPPVTGQFAVGDGRQRGRRAKGTRNFDTDFLAEAARKVPVRENGKVRNVTKQQAAIIRLFDNASSKGQTAAIALLLQHSSRIAEKGPQSTKLSDADDALLDAWLADRIAGTQPGVELGDPEPSADPGEGADGIDDHDR
jgi:hypothetical protein